MKRFTKLALLALAAGIFLPGATALADSHEGKFKVHGEVRARGEYIENYTDLQDKEENPTQFDDGFDIWPYRVRLGVTGEFTRNVKGHVEIQNLGNFGGDLFGPQRGADDPVLQGFRADTLTSETSLYQAFVDLTDIGDMLSIRVGRAEHTVGNELLMGDLDFYGGITYDGLRFTLDFESFDLDAFYYRLGEGNVSLSGAVAGGVPNGGDEDIHFAGAYANFDISDNGQDLTPYVLYKRDGIGANGIGLFDQHDFFTVGVLYEREINTREEVEDGRHWDWSAEAAIQTGSYDPNGNQNSFFVCVGDNGNGDCDIGGGIFEGWVGYNWELGENSRQRVHLGVFSTTGEDANPGSSDFQDGDIDFFIPMFGDIHENNRLGNADLFGTLAPINAAGSFPGGFTNLTNINLGYSIYGPKHDVMLAVHAFMTTEDQTVASGSEDDIGTEFDVEYTYHYSPNVDLTGGVALFQSGDLLDDFVPGNSADDITRVYGQVRLRF